jgi:RNA polymerase sigma factor (sigma-70 family)
MDPFGELYERHYPHVYRFALFLTGDHSRAEDLAADTFVRAWIARGRIRQETVRAYLLTITRNLYRDALRSRPAQEFIPFDDSIVDRSTQVETRPSAGLHFLRQRLKFVAKGDRRALLLYVVKEMTYEEVAQTLGVSVGAVKSRIWRARDALKHPNAFVLPKKEQT